VFVCCARTLCVILSVCVFVCVCVILYVCACACMCVHAEAQCVRLEIIALTVSSSVPLVVVWLY